MAIRRQLRFIGYPLSPLLLVGLGLYALLGRPFDDTFWWLLAILLYGVGDIVTTWIGVNRDDIEESMPVVRHVLGGNPGILGLTLFTAIGLVVLYAAYELLAWNRFRDIIPVGLSIWGAYAVYNNSKHILLDWRNTTAG